MLIDTAGIWSDIVALSRGPSFNAKESMFQLIERCAASVPHKDWALFRELDYERGSLEIVEWLPSALQADPPKVRISGLWFGLFKPVDEEGRPRTDLYVAGSTRYERADSELNWAVRCEYQPRPMGARSSILESIYEFSYGRVNGLGNDAEWPLAMGFAVISVRAAVTMLGKRALSALHSDIVGIATGFDDGDALLLGELTADGFSTAFR